MVKFSLQFKIIASLILVYAIVLSAITYSGLIRQKENLYNIFYEQAVTSVRFLNANFVNEEDFSDRPELLNSIYKIVLFNPNVARVNVNLSTESGLRVIASNDNDSIGLHSVSDSVAVFNNNKILTKVFTDSKKGNIFSVFMPINIKQETIGVYEIGLLMDPLERTVAQTQKQSLFTAILGFFLISLITFLLLKKIILSPIQQLKGGIEAFRKRKFSHRLQIRSNDEIGELSSTVNQMAEELQGSYEGLQKSYAVLEKRVDERTAQLKESKTILEIKVKARTQELQELADSLEEKVKQKTKELQENLDDLEKFYRLSVGRELKMMQLKKRIRNLEKKLAKTISETKKR